MRQELILNHFPRYVCFSASTWFSVPFFRTTSSGRRVKTPRAVMIDLGGSTGPMVEHDDAASYEAKTAGGYKF